jgi:hypothetical protein
VNAVCELLSEFQFPLNSKINDRFFLVLNRYLVYSYILASKVDGSSEKPCLGSDLNIQDRFTAVAGTHSKGPIKSQQKRNRLCHTFVSSITNIVNSDEARSVKGIPHLRSKGKEESGKESV